MAETIAVFLITTVAGAAAATGVTLAVTTALVQIGIAVGTSLLVQELFGASASAPSPTDRQFVARSPTAIRKRAYGRVRTAGDQMFIEASRGVLYRVQVHNDGEIDAVEEHLVDDTIVTLDENGWVEQDAFKRSGEPKINIQFRTGTDAPAVYDRISAEFDEWDDTHLGKGIVHSAIELHPVGQSAFLKFYPSGQDTRHLMTYRAARIWDPRDEAQDAADPSTWVWSANAALVILDFMRHRTGFGMPDEWLLPEIETWKQAADDCDEAIPRAIGGTVPRYQIWGAYSYDERPADVLSRMLMACNGKVWVGSNGGVTLSVGVWREPDVTLDDDAIVAYQSSSGNEAPDSANVVAAIYMEPAFGYIEAEAQPWENSADVATFGERRVTASLLFCPNHSQCRRVQKQMAAKLSPAWRGTLRTNLRGLAALNERFIRISSADMGLDLTAEIESIEFAISDGSIVEGLIIDWTSVEASSFDWDAETEEGVPSQVPPETAGVDLSPPEDFGVTIEPRASGGTAYAVAVATWDAVPDVVVQVEYRVQSTPEVDWLRATDSPEGAGALETPPLTDGEAYEFRARAVGFIGPTDWTDVVTATVTVDAVAPGVPTSLSISEISGDVTVGWTQPNSANVVGARVYRHTADDSASASVVSTIYGGPSAGLSDTDTPGSGTFYYWVAAINGSGVESARTAAGSVTIV